jgi:ParB-like nuclease domain
MSGLPESMTGTLRASGLVALADRIELWPIEKLRPYERNPRTHSDAQVNQIAASMVEFGWTNPVLVDEQGGILAGHGRLLAARKLGLAEVPVIRFADTTLIDLAAGGTPVDLEFAYTLSAQAKLVLTAHEVYLPKPKLAVEGPGGVQASFDFRGAKNGVAGRMLTVTLTNDLDGTVYA